MKPLFKTLFGSTRTISAGLLALAVAVIALHSAEPWFAGIILPVCLLGGAFHLAKQ
jgi:hypothetical protein